jgi:hypothetical protein
MDFKITPKGDWVKIKRNFLKRITTDGLLRPKLRREVQTAYKLYQRLFRG